MSVNANLIGHTGYTGASTVEKARFLQTSQDIGSSKVPVYIQYQGSEEKGLPIACEKIIYCLTDIVFTYSGETDNSFTDYPYIGVYSNEIITDTMTPIGVPLFNFQKNQKYAPVIQTQNGECRIWSRDIPEGGQTSMAALLLIEKQN